MTDLVSVVEGLTTHHCVSESTFGVEQYILEHILHCVCVDLFGSMMVDCMNNRNLGILWSLMMFPDDLGQAIESPSCGMEALAAQECCKVLFCYSSLTENRCVCECCAQQVSGIVGDPFHANAMDILLLMFLLREGTSGSLLGDLSGRGGGAGGATGGALTGGVTFDDDWSWVDGCWCSLVAWLCRLSLALVAAVDTC